MKKLFASLALPLAIGVATPVIAEGDGENVTGRPFVDQVDSTTPPGMERMNDRLLIRDQTAASSYQDVATAIQRSISNDMSLSAPARKVSVNARDHKVVLSGQVQTIEEKATIVAYAQQAAPLVIEDRLVVRNPGPLD